MNDAGVTRADATTAASALARVRWGDTRVRRLAHELAGRADELGPVERSELALALAIVTQADPNTTMEAES
jgi:hypothetical protein